MIREFVGHSAAYTFANLLSRGTVLVWLIVLPHFLSAADYGVLGLVTTIAAIVNVVVPLEISQALARYYPAAVKAERRAWADSAWTFTLLALVIVAALAFVLSEQLNRLLFGSPRYLSVFRLAIAYCALNTAFTFTQNQFRWAFLPRAYTLVTAVFALITLMLSVGLAAASPYGVDGVLIGLVIGAAVGVIVGVATLPDMLGLGIDRVRLFRMLRFSLPLVPASIAILLSTYASRFILNGMLTLREVGLYTWASQLASIPALLLLGVQGAITPLVMKHHAAPGTPVTIARIFETVVAVELCLCLAAGLLTPDLIRLLGYSAYAGAGALVMILAPAYLMLQLYVFSPGFALAERTSLQLLVSSIAAVCTIVFNYLLIAQAGLIGAALATLGSSIVFVGLWFTLSIPLYRIPVRWGRVALFLLLFPLCAEVSRILPSLGVVETLTVKLLLLVVQIGGAVVLGLAHAGQLRLLVAWLRPRNAQVDGLAGGV